MKLSVAEMKDIVTANPDDVLTLNRLDHMIANDAVNDAEGMEILKGAAKRGCPLAQYKLFGHSYEINEDGDAALAFQYLLSSAKSGLGHAQVSLSSVYQAGILGMRIDMQESFKWAVRAAAWGLSDGQAQLSFLYR
jgi:TPR repeat protein